MKWNTLSKNEKNLLIHEKVLKLPLPGKVPEDFLHDLIAMGVSIEHQGTQIALDEYDPTEYIPDYIEESSKGIEVLQFIGVKDDLRDEFLLKLRSINNGEVEGNINMNDRICHAAALVMGFVDE